MTASQTRPWTQRLPPLLADLACVLALAVGGKGSHDAGESAWVVLRIAWPFAVGAALAHAALAASRRPALPVSPYGALVLVATYGVGMALRAVSGRGLAPAFLVVAALFLTATMLGWRGALVLARRRRLR